MSIAHKLRLSVWIVLVVAVVANAALFGGRATSWIADRTGAILAPVTGWTVHLRALVGTMFNGVDAATQNIALRQQVLQLQGQLAQQDALQQELQFYRTAAGIRDRTGTEPIEAGIFSYSSNGGIRQAIINRGTIDWIAEGNTVVMSDGTLVGTVAHTSEHSATILMLGDPAFQVAARIVGTAVSGLVRVDGTGTLVLDLVQKDETVTEGSAIVTSGDDQRPAGLVIGTVRSVDNNATTLFKVVRIAPAVPDGIAGHVLVIRP